VTDQILIALGALIVSGLSYFAGVYRTKRNLDRKKREGRVTRDGLAKLMLEGQGLMGRLTSTDETIETIEEAIDIWATNVEAWLSENLEDSYTVRFRNSAGIPMGTFIMRRGGLNTKEGPLNGFMRVRLARLGQFVEEHAVTAV
jgi:hypothetical protein